jgi:hypothetical protein
MKHVARQKNGSKTNMFYGNLWLPMPKKTRKNCGEASEQGGLQLLGFLFTLRASFENFINNQNFWANFFHGKRLCIRFGQ